MKKEIFNGILFKFKFTEIKSRTQRKPIEAESNALVLRTKYWDSRLPLKAYRRTARECLDSYIMTSKILDTLSCTNRDLIYSARHCYREQFSQSKALDVWAWGEREPGTATTLGPRPHTESHIEILRVRSTSRKSDLSYKQCIRTSSMKGQG